MFVGLVVAYCVRGDFSGARTGLAVAYLLPRATAFRTGEPTFTRTALTFKKLDDVENIYLFYHSRRGTSAASYDPFGLAVVAHLLYLFGSLAGKAGLITVSSSVAKLAGLNSCNRFFEFALQLFRPLVVFTLKSRQFEVFIQEVGTVVILPELKERLRKVVGHLIWQGKARIDQISKNRIRSLVIASFHGG